MNRTQFKVIAIVIWLCGAGIVGWMYYSGQSFVPTAVVAVAMALLGCSPQVARQWERAILLRLGRFAGVRGPGLFFIIPFVDRVASIIDQRVITTTFNAEETLTRDTVPVTVDAVLFWHVHDPEQAALEVQDYDSAIARAAQTALRDLIGRTTLADLLMGREIMEKSLQEMIDSRIREWGVTVQTVEMRDVVIPPELQEAMSREAQAEREKNARVILGNAEVLIAEQFRQAGTVYANNPVALQLRAMNILYEGLKEKGALMIVPSSAVETMGLGGLAGMAALHAARMNPTATDSPAVGAGLSEAPPS
jgi:regulator of protease activity HflC (stomatin/prohibitin superfamily)